MNELNSRYLRLINELIESYKSGNVEFSYFVIRLDEFMLNLDNPPHKWFENAKSLWIDLEEINSVLLDESNKDKTIEDFKSEITELVNKLCTLIIIYPKKS